MTEEGRLLAALSFLETAYKSALKASILISDAKRSEVVNALGHELCNEYLDMELDALKRRFTSAPLPS